LASYFYNATISKEECKIIEKYLDYIFLFSGYIVFAFKNCKKCRILSNYVVNYVISDKKDIAKIKFIDDAITVNFIADAEIINSRFAQRMNGNLPKPVEIMIEKQLS